MGSPQGSEATASKQSHIISKVLAPAVRLWLRTQVEAVEDLQVQIEAGDRQVLSGCVAKASVMARNVIYQGISLSYLALVAKGIRVNLGQVIKGKPLQLLEVVPVQAEAIIQQSDLNASLQAPLLADAVAELLLGWLRSGLGTDDFLPGIGDASAKLIEPQAQLQTDRLTLSTQLVAADRSPLPLTLRTGLEVAEANQLCLRQPQWLPHAQAKRGMPINELDGFAIDLGSDVQIQQLVLEEGQLVCKGILNVIP